MRALILLLSLLPFGVASGATFFVTKEADDNGPCTPDDCALREAVLAANALLGPDLVEIPAGTYQLSLPGPLENFAMTGDIDILDDLVLRGESARTVTVIGDGSDRIFHINFSGGSVELSNMTVTGGSGAGPGGGVWVTGPRSVLLKDISIHGNTSLSGTGGGLSIAAIDSAVLQNVTLSDNQCPGNRGGGAFIFAGVPDSVDLINVTVSGNSARAGGGLYLLSSAFINLRNVTVANNTAPIVSGILGDFTVRLNYFNVLVSNNDCGYVVAIPVTNDHSMEGPTDTCFGPGTGDGRGIPDLMLGPLADNGGPTRTHALLPGSPAIDAALDADCPADDQRGFGRPVDGDGDGVARCDVGAFEAGASNPFEIPTLGALGLAILAGLLGGCAVVVLRRRSTRPGCECPARRGTALLRWVPRRPCARV